MDLNKIIQSRKSCRKFSSKKPNWRDIIECVDSMRHTPSAGKNFLLKIIIVSDKEKIKRLAEAAEQKFIEQAQYVVVVYSNPSRVKNAFGERGIIYSRQQAGAAIQNFLLKIQEKNLDTCWIGHFNEGKIKKELKVPEKMEIEAIFPIGYRIKEEKPTRKISLDNILYFERHENKQMKKEKKFFRV
jgi:nitroreductase